jgi:glutamate formiminotransferase
VIHVDADTDHGSGSRSDGRLTCDSFDENPRQFPAVIGQNVIRPLHMHNGTADLARRIDNSQTRQQRQSSRLRIIANDGAAPQAGPRVTHPRATSTATAGRLLSRNHTQPRIRS